MAIIAAHCIIDDLAVRLAFNTLMFTFAGILRPLNRVGERTTDEKHIDDSRPVTYIGP